MSLNEEERTIIVRKELDRAHETFEEIEVMRQAGKWNGAANRIYYSVFHAVNALFVFDGLQTVRHKGSHALFSLHYIKTGKLPDDLGRFYNNLQTLREKSDYNCFYNVNEQDVLNGMKKAMSLINAIENYITKTINPMT